MQADDILKCQKCSSKFKSQYYLNAHKCLNCTICYLEFSNLEQLQNHSCSQNVNTAEKQSESVHEEKQENEIA